MNNNLKRILTAILFFVCYPGFSQEAEKSSAPTQNSSGADAPVQMADGLYQSGKIYVVIIVIAILFVGILSYLIMLDRKIGKLEKEIGKKI